MGFVAALMCLAAALDASPFPDISAALAKTTLTLVGFAQLFQHRIIECFGRDLEDHLALAPLPWAGDLPLDQADHPAWP